jgi:hypothetical protein
VKLMRNGKREEDAPEENGERQSGRNWSENGYMDLGGVCAALRGERERERESD